MTKYKINLKEVPNEISISCPFGRGNNLTYQYNFECELNKLVEWLNLEITSISCEKDSNASIVVTSEIDSIDELQEKMEPVFAKMICFIHYDNKNPMQII